MLPPPISLPLRTRSYAFAVTSPGASVMRARSASDGDVNGWCMATQRLSSASQSNSGKSTTQRNS